MIRCVVVANIILFLNFNFVLNLIRPIVIESRLFIAANVKSGNIPRLAYLAVGICIMASAVCPL